MLKHHEIWGCITLGQIWPKLPIFPKDNFLVNLNVTFIYLLTPIMLFKISQILTEWVLRFGTAKIWGNLIQITHLSHKEFFGKNECYFLLTFCFLACCLTSQEDF